MSVHFENDKLYKAEDLSMFVMHPFNRDITKTSKLRDSMVKHGFIPAYPLHCRRREDGKLEVKAGNHRLQVAMELEIPVFFVITEDEATILELEDASRAWNIQDYFRSLIKAGNEDAIKVWAAHEETGISLNQCLTLMSGTGVDTSVKSREIKLGKININPKNEVWVKVSTCVAAATKAGVAFSTHSRFVAALAKLCYLPEFKAHEFCKKVKKRPAAIKKYDSTDSFLETLEEFCNYNVATEQRLPWKLLANQSSHKRRGSQRDDGGVD